MPEPACRWLRVTEVTGWIGDAGKILGTCDLLGGNAYEIRCKMCDQHKERDHGHRGKSVRGRVEAGDSR